MEKESRGGKKIKEGKKERKKGESLLSPPGYKVCIAMHPSIPQGPPRGCEIDLELGVVPSQRFQRLSCQSADEFVDDVSEQNADFALARIL
jgi:hypothetical protein